MMCLPFYIYLVKQWFPYDQKRWLLQACERTVSLHCEFCSKETVRCLHFLFLIELFHFSCEYFFLFQ